MKVRLFLARYAEVQAGMIYASGIGVSEIGPDPAPFAIGAQIEVTWEETNRPHHFRFVIVDADGRPFEVPTPTGDRQPFEIPGDVNVGRPPNAVPGQSFIVPVTIFVMPLPLQPGRRYVVRALIDDQPYDEVTLTVRPPRT